MNKKRQSETRNTRTTLKSYANRVFQESTVGMVSSLAQTSSKPRRFFKAFVLIFCLIAFFYQSAQFLTVVFEYPTVVNVDILRPVEFNVPAYTFCDNNGIKRSLYCKKYPENCEEADESLCKQYEGYCGPNRTLVPKKEFYLFKEKMTPEEMKDINADKEDFLIYYLKHNEEDVTGPHLRMKDPSYGYLMQCYSLNERVNSSLNPKIKKKELLLKYPIDQFEFRMEADEIFIPGTRPGVLFSIHSPFEAVNPFIKGIFMKPGRTYLINIRMEEEILLQRPYQTDCINYTERWEANGRKGPRKQEMCLQQCLTATSQLCYGCVYFTFLFPTNGTICTTLVEEAGKMECSKETIEEQIDNCMAHCKKDCHRTRYVYEVQERYTVQFDGNGDILKDLDRHIFVEIYLEEDEIVILKHSPKYMIVEVFSTIGGFIGGWLGISLLEVSDIFEGFIRIFRYSFKRRS